MRSLQRVHMEKMRVGSASCGLRTKLGLSLIEQAPEHKVTSLQHVYLRWIDDGLLWTGQQHTSRTRPHASSPSKLSRIGHSESGRLSEQPWTSFSNERFMEFRVLILASISVSFE